MKKRSWTIYLMAVFALILASCGDEMESLGTGSGNDSRAFTLQLRASDTSTEAGEDAYNENHIANVSVFFFKDTETATCAYMKRNISTGNTNTLKVPLDETFTPGDYYIFVVANTQNNTEDVSGYTLKQMKDRLVYTQFATDNKAQESFIMQGLTEKVRVENGATGGQVTLKRLAAKIVLIPEVEPSIEVDNVTYTPELDRMDVALHNLTNITHVGGYELTKEEYNRLPEENKAKMYATTEPRRYTNTAAEGETPAYSHIPFYSYPSTWKAYIDGPGHMESEHQTFLTFRIPWTCVKDGVQLSTNYYYRVPITNEIDEVNKTRSLKSNTLYKIKMTVGVLGSIDPGQVTPDVELEYEISDWKSVGISADANKYNYLELETNYVEMNNESRADIGFTSSSDVTVELAEVRFWNYSVTDYFENVVTNNKPEKPSGNAPEPPNRDDYNIILPGTWWLNSKYWEAYQKYEDDLKNYNEKVEQYEAWEKYFGNQDYSINVYGQILIFEHVLESSIHVPYTYKIKITNKDGQTEFLTIKQYPPIYIKGESNQNNGSDNRFVYGKKSTGSINDDKPSSIGSVAHYEDGSNHNPNQYTIYATVLDATSSYIIGDPRQEQTTQLSDLTKYQGGLQEYRPTKDDDETRSIIAPVFKIASSWGQTTSTNYTQLQKRCAAYQENGYPAGRWRIPTEAEIQFVISLSDQGYIPELFDGDYYASSGRYYQSGSGFSRNPDKNGEHAVRCIYDVWYWGDEKLANPNVFTWGDTDPIRPNN